MENDTLLLERYKIIEPLGEGGSGKVYKALDTKMERTVAIKSIPAGRRRAIRALREAKTVALLNHPNIVTLYEFEQHESAYYLIMEYIEGRSLGTVLGRFDRLPIELALAIAVQTCEALAFAHQNDVIHRDIKPANLRLVSDGRVKVMDFGIARLRSAAKTSGATVEGEIVGTFAYMSPEQTSGEMVDERSDIFSLGVLLYEMVTGALPFEGDTPAATIYNILNQEPRPPEQIVNDIPPALSRIILKAIAKDVGDRQTDATEMKAQLERCRLSTAPPAETVREMLGELREPAVETGPGPAAKARAKTTALVRDYQDTIITTGYAATAALCAAWADSYLPFFLTQLKLFFPLLIFFLALFLPPIGFAALLALVSAGMWQVSPYLGAVTGAAAIVYWLTLGRGFPQIAIVPFAAPLLAWLKIPFLFPLAVGLVFSPLLAAFIVGLGGLMLAGAEVVGELHYAWSISLRPDLISGLKFSSQASDLAVFIDYFKAQPWLFGQIAVWAAVALSIATIRSVKTRTSRWLALGTGIIGLVAGYQIVPAFLEIKYDFSRLFLQPLVLSLIILLALMFIFLPAKPSD